MTKHLHRDLSTTNQKNRPFGLEKIRNSEISFTYSENRKNRIRLDVYSNNEFMGKIDCDFATPFNAVWSKHDGVIIVKYD